MGHGLLKVPSFADLPNHRESSREGAASLAGSAFNLFLSMISTATTYERLQGGAHTDWKARQQGLSNRRQNRPRSSIGLSLGQTGMPPLRPGLAVRGCAVASEPPNIICCSQPPHPHLWQQPSTPTSTPTPVATTIHTHTCGNNYHPHHCT